MIAYAQRSVGRSRPRYSNSLRSANYLALGVNSFFVVLHLVQTHLWHDGLAQDVSIWSALGSVVVMLVWVLLMENPRRGLFFGRKIGFPRRSPRWRGATTAITSPGPSCTRSGTTRWRPRAGT